MKHGDVISVKRCIFVTVTPEEYMSFDKEFKLARFKIGQHARLGNLMDAYREHQGTETAGYESKACSVEPLPRQQAKSLGTDNDCW